MSQKIKNPDPTQNNKSDESDKSDNESEDEIDNESNIDINSVNDETENDKIEDNTGEIEDEDKEDDDKEEDDEEDDEDDEYDDEELEEKDIETDFYSYVKKDIYSDDEDDNNLIENIELKEKMLHIKKEKRITKPFLTKYERVRIIGERTKQLSLGAKPMIKDTKNLTSHEIALLELENNVMPFIIERPLPNGFKETWHLNELS